MSLSRRQFIQATGLALGAGSLPLRAQANSTSNPHYLFLRYWNPAVVSRCF